MGYTALDKMQEINERIEQYRTPVGPMVPSFQAEYKEPSMEYHALRFIRDDCEDLRFVRDQEHMELKDRDGKSTDVNQIPLNMQYDLDRLCLENALKRFFDSGSQEDAFDVYYCYIDMFFGGSDSGRKMVELLSEFEANTSVLLSNHRDHYAHSVYVFAIGLALFRESKLLRKAYCDYYCPRSNANSAAHEFLQFWGFTALFHDMGYPFELVYEQILGYFTTKDDRVNADQQRKKIPFLAYRKAEKYMAENFNIVNRRLMTEKQRKRLDGKTITPALLLAECIAEKLWPTCNELTHYKKYLKEATASDSLDSYRAYLEELIDTKSTEPERHDYHMDHAYFSVMILLHNLQTLIPDKSKINYRYADALAAIMLHNSLFQHEILKEATVPAPLSPKTFPLAYFLMLCDELQCWNRRSYGQNTRRECFPFACDLEIRGNGICGNYLFDKYYTDQLAPNEKSGVYTKIRSGTYLEKFEKLFGVNMGEKTINLSVKLEQREWNWDTNQYVSYSSFQHLYSFAVALNAYYAFGLKGETVPNDDDAAKRAFDTLSLEYRLSNIAFAKRFAFYLHKLRCFYTDREVAYKRKTDFEDWELDRIGELEHNRWLEERKSMGWIYGCWYLDSRIGKEKRTSGGEAGVSGCELPAVTAKQRRELIRVHKNLIPYWGLTEDDVRKDKQPLKDVMAFLEKHDGIHIYYLNQDALPPITN